MKYKNVWAVYFSATGTTKKIVTEIAERAAQRLAVPLKEFDFTLPGARESARAFSADDFVVFGTPVIAGRVPNVLLKYLDTLSGGGAAATAVVSYGNRDYDDALIELRDILEKTGFHTIAGAAFIGEHSFSEVLAAGRPDSADLALADGFAEKVADKAASLTEYAGQPVHVSGTPFPYRGYYQPRDRKGVPVDIRKVKPVTGPSCDDCKICADECPMGSIDKDDVKEIPRICIKCCACVKKCPKKAKYFDDAAFLYHKHELEEGFARRAKPELFL